MRQWGNEAIALPTDLAAALTTARERLGAFSDLRYFDELASTNDTALALAAAGAAEGTSVLTDGQRAGRGRHGHSWFSPPGAGMYLSVIVRPEPKIDRAALSLITLAAGAAVARAVAEETHLPAELKWPNDLVIGRPWRKLGGLLCESTGTGARVEAVVVGMGINLRRAAYPPELERTATSIETELGRPIDRARIVVATLERLRAAMDDWRHGGQDAVCAAWRRFGGAALRATPVRWHDQGRPQRGVAIDIDRDGALVVERDGRRERLIAGEVTWERLSPFKEHDA